MKPERHKKPRPPLDEEALERAGLFYAGRYATTRAKLGAYLARKLKERGWAGARDPDIPALVEKFARLGYVDDAAFAATRAASLGRRGYGERRVRQALHAAGIGEEDAAPAYAEAEAGAWEAALRFAERKRIGPFAPSEPDRDARRKAFAAMVRAGHSMELARRIVAARLGEVPHQDDR